MTFTRREALGAIGVSALACQGCLMSPGRAGQQHWSDPDARLLNRFGFGPSSTDLASLSKLGHDSWFAEQLKAPVPEPLWLEAKLVRLPMLHLSPWELRDWPEQDVIRQLQTAAILRAVYTPSQLRERMVHFWSDHFNVFARKGLGAYRKPLDEQLVVRKNALGTFPDMLRASARSSAMLVYLDQQASTAAHPNENYGRELLELHTLGVKEGYTQKDVMEVARCFTGWTEERGFLKSKGAFKFDADIHDQGEKNVLGHRIPAGGGVEDGEMVLDILSQHPATAAHVSGKLCRWFFGDQGSQVAPAVAKTYLQTGGDIKEMLQTVYRFHPDSVDAGVMKRPFDFIVSSIRALGAETDGEKPLHGHLAEMGQPLYQWPMPDGYPVDTEAWSGSLLSRWNFAFALTRGQIPGTTIDPGRMPDIGSADSFVFGAPHSEVSSAMTGINDVREALALCLSSPAYQWR